MISNRYLLFIVLILLGSCSKIVYQTDKQSVHGKDLRACFKYDCKLTAIDLTEDVSRVSTKNDELILLIYRDNINQHYPDLIYQDSFIVDSLFYSKEFTIKDSLPDNSSYTFVLIELDTRKNLQQIEPLIRFNLTDINSAVFNGDSKFILDLLGDDDLLGIKRINSVDMHKKGNRLDFKGIHLFDSFHYQLELK